MHECGFKREISSKLEYESSKQSHHVICTDQSPPTLEELGAAPAGPAAIPVCVKQEPEALPAATLETLEPATATSGIGIGQEIERRLSTILDPDREDEFAPFLSVKDEPNSEGEQLQLSSDDTNDSTSTERVSRSPKSWTATDMDNALEALRKHNMSLTKASATYGIPSTTLWQRAHRLGIDTPKKEITSKTWSDEDLKAALQALRAGEISANKASKAYGIPSSTLYKIARRENIRLSAPFNAAPTAWRRRELRRALDDIRAARRSVQAAAAHYRIPTGTLYGRCKREGIELSRSNPTPWSEDAMGEALEAVRVGQMSINQAAIHFNLPYSSLYGRFKRCKYTIQGTQQEGQQNIQDYPDADQQSTSSVETSYSQHQQQTPSQEYNEHYQLNQQQQTSNSYYDLEQNSMVYDPQPQQNYGDQSMYYGHNSIVTL